ncbi:MAG: hypothetical protein ACYDCI_08180 [Candidatus Limnocylindrales bacterium]
MSAAHALVGQVAIALAIGAAVWSVGLLVTRRTPGTLYLVNLLWVFLAVAVAALMGAGTLVSGSPLHDPLHLVYGLLALGILPGTMLFASGRDARGRTIVGAVGAIVLLILLARLFQTGG